ncbi:MAG: hypothetical protein ACOCTG_04310 [Bacteroidota bacterium]
MTFDELTDALKDRFGEHGRQVEPHHWMYEVMTDSRRSQVVHLLCKQTTVDGDDVSRVVAVSPIGKRPSRLDGEYLLRMNARLDVGAISIEDFRDDEGDLVSYLTLRASHLLSTMDFEEVWEMIEKVARVADRLEKEIYASDIH